VSGSGSGSGGSAQGVSRAEQARTRDLAQADERALLEYRKLLLKLRD
jgi:hypothetical protein